MVSLDLFLIKFQRSYLVTIKRYGRISCQPKKFLIQETWHAAKSHFHYFGRIYNPAQWQVFWN